MFACDNVTLNINVYNNNNNNNNNNKAVLYFELVVTGSKL